MIKTFYSKLWKRKQVFAGIKLFFNLILFFLIFGSQMQVARASSSLPSLLPLKNPKGLAKQAQSNIFAKNKIGKEIKKEADSLALVSPVISLNDEGKAREIQQKAQFKVQAHKDEAIKHYQGIQRDILESRLFIQDQNNAKYIHNRRFHKGCFHDECFYDMENSLIKEIEKLKGEKGRGEKIEERELRESKEGKAKETKKAKSHTFYAFISFSMPEESLKEVVIQLKKIDGVMVLRGLDQDSFVKTAKRIQELNKDGVKAIIHPKLFDLFHITQVPTYVLLKSDGLDADLGSNKDRGKDKNKVNEKKNNFDKLIGNVTVKYALERFAEDGDCKREAEGILISFLEQAELMSFAEVINPIEANFGEFGPQRANTFLTQINE